MILGFASYVLSMQGGQVLRVRDAHAFVERVYWVKRYLYELVLKKEEEKFKGEKITLDELETKVETTASEIPKKSSLAAFKNRLQLVTATGTWKSREKSKSLSMTAFVYREQEKK